MNIAGHGQGMMSDEVAADPRAVWQALLDADLIEMGKRSPPAGLLGGRPGLAGKFRRPVIEIAERAQTATQEQTR